MTVTPDSAAIGEAEIRSMMLPLTSTWDGAERALPLPSKIRTFWKSVVLALVGGLPCARRADDRPILIIGSAARMILRCPETIRNLPRFISLLLECFVSGNTVI